MRKRHTWKWLLAGLALVVIGIFALALGWIGNYLERRGLDQADKLASVGGLFVGIIGLVISVVSIVVSVVTSRPSSRTIAPAPVVPTVPKKDTDAGLALRSDLERLRDVANVDHDRLFGVESELESLAAALRSRDSDWIISVWGGPGVGKTALAYELIKGHAGAAGFRRVASVSAKFSHLDRVGHLATDTRRAEIDWRDLLVDVGQQLAPGQAFNPALIEEQLPNAIPEEPCLIFVDNLESAPEAKLAVRYLAERNVIRPHKVVLTTRESVWDPDIRELRERGWDGPDQAAARDYARYLAGDDPMLNPTVRDLNDVVAAAQRTPLLIQIIVHQAREERLTIREVIARLRDVEGTLGKDVWSYCYAHSLNVLADRVGQDAAAGLMSVFCLRPPGNSFGSDEFHLLSGIDDRGVFEQTRAMACKLSLVRSLAGNSRFTVHSLLREFYCAGPPEATSR